MKILVIRFSSIGDIVLTSALIRCLKLQMPDETELHFLTKSSYVPLLKYNPYLNKAFGIHESVSEITAELKKEKYDKIIDLHTNLRSFQTTLSIGKLASRFFKWNAAKWRMVKLKRKLTVPPVALRYIKTAELFGIEYDGKGLDFFLPETINKESITIKIPEITDLLNRDSAYIVLVAGGKYKTKCLPALKMHSLAIGIIKPVIVLGGHEDEGYGQFVAAESSNIINACGRLSLLESAWVIKHAFKIVSHDTGLMHIACAFNKPLAVIWGNTVPEFGFSSFKPLENASETLNFQVENLACRPCSKIGYMQCPKTHFDCMNKIDLQPVIDWVNR